MISQRRNFREAQLEKQLQQLKQENAKLKDCVLMQQKIIEKQRKQKFTFQDQIKKTKGGVPYNSLRLTKSKKLSLSDEADSKLVSCLSSRANTDYNTCETPKLFKLRLSNNDSRKTTQELIDQSMKKASDKNKLQNSKDLKGSQHSNSSTCLYHPPDVSTHVRRKSYLQKLAEKIVHQSNQ